MKKFIEFLIRILAFFVPKKFMRFFNHETVSYLFFGGLTFLVSVLFFALFYYSLGMRVALAGTVSDVLAIIFAFFTNKIFVFESPEWRAKVLVPELVKFGISRALTLVLGILALVLLVDILGYHAMVMRVLTTIIIVIIGNYVLSKWLVFTSKGESNES
ncbi:MAG: GtrA family protein [Defluviitaleaceae bacterium]|nr:GtrA family protein [Defluviitaleaceae bacterium]